MSPQRETLLSLPQLNLDFVKPHGTPGVYSGDSNEAYVLLRLPRGKANLVLNRHYQAIGFLSPKDSIAIRSKLAHCITSEWEGNYPSFGLNWKDPIWYVDMTAFTITPQRAEAS